MIYLASNLKHLRTAQKLSQQSLAEKILISRSNLAKYEKGLHDPGIEVLLRMSRYFHLTIDMLLTIDLSKVDVTQLQNQNKIILPIQVDTQGDQKIEIVPQDASAGYLGNYSDPEYIEQLEHLSLPFLPNIQNCRAFPVNGDSMPPIIDGSYIIGKYIATINEIKPGSRYIIVSRDEGIVFKRIFKIENRELHLQSDNPRYRDFTIEGKEILEIWEFVAAITVQDSSERHFQNGLLEKIDALQTELEFVGNKMKAE